MTNPTKIFLSTCLLFSICFLWIQDASAQGEKRIIQFSGVIVGEDSISGVPGVHIYVPKAGRGTTSNIYGFFSMPVLVDDSVLVSAVGYKKQHYIIPGDQGDNLTMIVELLSDTTYLPTIEIFPYPTEELFKEAILALNLPIEDYQNDPYLGDEVLAQMLATMPMDAAMNHKFYMNQQFYQLHNRYSLQDPWMALTNPFAWAQFIQSIKRGDLKNKK